MLNKIKNPFDQKRLRRASWLALLSLAWLQLTLASHQFDHVATYFADSCNVCIQLDRIDDSVAGQPAVAVSPLGNAAEPEVLMPRGPSRSFVRHFQSRAPPLI